jgi:hypothetical protein
MRSNEIVDTVASAWSGSMAPGQNAAFDRKLKRKESHVVTGYHLGYNPKSGRYSVLLSATLFPSMRPSRQAGAGYAPEE